MRLYLQEGMPVMITQNQDCLCGIANGQLGKIQFEPGTTWKTVADESLEGILVKLAGSQLL